MAIQPSPPAEPARELAHEDDVVAHHELAAYLQPAAFPARQDDLMALLIRKRAPSRLLWRLSRCSAGRTYRSLDDVWRDLA